MLWLRTLDRELEAHPDVEFSLRRDLRGRYRLAAQGPGWHRDGEASGLTEALAWLAVTLRNRHMWEEGSGSGP